MIYLETQGRGIISGVTIETAIKKEYGLYSRFATWGDILDDGVVGLVVQKNPKHDGWDVLDHVIGISQATNGQRPAWL